MTHRTTEPRNAGSSARPLPYVIFELANAHGGDKYRLNSALEHIRSITYQPRGIKFQVFKPDLIALPDYEWFKTYQELFLEPDEWAQIIESANAHSEIWLDIFDVYGVGIFNANRTRIAGVKVQASVLDNLEVSSALDRAGVRDIRLMINIAGHELSQIAQYVEEFGRLKPRQLILQIGFQSYPTLVGDTGLSKVPILRAAFPDVPLAFADHAHGETLFARRVPSLAVLAGCSYIEKHFWPCRCDAKYDAYSSLEPGEMEEMLNCLAETSAASQGPFVNSAEARYLLKSYQVPVAETQLPAGTLVGRSDLSFRRTNRPGLTWQEIQAQQARFTILGEPLAKHATLIPTLFRRARIGVIVACRMKSSRLKNKATAPIHGVPSIERCLRNCQQFPYIDQVILATSTLEDDAVLEAHTTGCSARFWRGDPDDVIQRYLDACAHFGIDVIVRVTGDCPSVSPEIAGVLLEHHFRAGADYTAPVQCAVGSSGEVYNTEALQRVITLLGGAEHSEYMTWYLRNNPHVFKLNLVELPSQLIRDYRLTLDYPEDLAMFNKLYERLEERGQEPSLSNVFSVLDSEPSIPAMNAHLTLRYQSDKELIDKLNRVTRIHLSEANGQPCSRDTGAPGLRPSG